MKYIFGISTLLCISVIIILSINNNRLKVKYNQLFDQYSLEISNAEEIKNYLTEKDTLQFLSENIVLNPDTKLYLENSDSVKLKDLIKKGENLIVFRYSEFNCSACYERNFIDFKAFINRFKEKNIIFLASYKNLRDLYNFLRLQNFNCKVYNLKGVVLNLPIEKFNAPYFFILNENLKVSNVYAIDKSHPENLNIYLDNIFSLYFKVYE